MQKKQNSTRNAVIVIIALGILIAGFIWAYQSLSPKGAAGEKALQIEIVVEGNPVKEYNLNTDAEFLRQALEETNLIQGDESAYGLYVKTVDGITADESNQEWWCFTKGGEQLMTGVDDTPIADGDHFEITLTVGYGS